MLDERLGDAAATLGDSANKTQVVVNSAILVFREGLEAVLILAAITASFVGAKRRMRRPVLIGAALGLFASLITWVLAQTILTSLDQYGEKLEAVVGIVAIAVLLLITNWFFHKVYWSEWIGKFHRQRKRLERFDSIGFLSAQVIGLVLLRVDERLPRGLRDGPLPAVAGAERRHRDRRRGRRPRARDGARRRRAHLRAAAQAAVQEDADSDRRDDRLRADRDGRADRAHDAGHRLAADHAARLRPALLAEPLVRRLPDGRDGRRPARRRRLRDRLVLPRAGGAREAAAAGGPQAPGAGRARARRAGAGARPGSRNSAEC